MYERQNHKMISRGQFARRMVRHILLGLGLIGLALLVGMAGYHYFAKLNWIDSFLNASMILGGMGPVDPLPSDGAKLFAGYYALFSGVFFLVCVGVVVAPIFHRILHHFHLDPEEEEIVQPSDRPSNKRPKQK
jgi:hypothetical protein